MSGEILLDDFYITNVEVPVQATNVNISHQSTDSEPMQDLSSL